MVSAVLARGDKVIATARCPLAIQDLPESSSLERLELDVTASESVLSEKIQAAVELFGAIDVLVNNAGFVVSGVVEELR